MPIVSITIEKAGWPRIGRITTRSERKPSPAIAPIVASTDSQNGKPSKVMQARPQNAPSIIRSPWAKLTVSVAL